MALLPVPAALAITAAAAVAPHPVVADAGFVLVVFAAVYARRFGPRGTALGMVTFMAYFFTLYLRAKISELPWLIGAVLVGTLCSFVWSVYLLPDRPESVLRESIRSLRARMAIVVDTTAETVRAGQLDERRRRRLRIRTGRLNETALMVQGQIEDRVNPGALWPGVSGEDLALWLFDAELTVERLATAGARAAAADIPAATRAELADTVALLARAIRIPQLRRACTDRGAGSAAVRADVISRRLAGAPPALAIVDTAKATADIRARMERVVAGAAAQMDITQPPPAPDSDDAEQQVRPGLLPSTRQAVQVAVAAALAIVIGEAVSPSRWYWAVIAAFVVFAGTNSWAETLTKGWQRLLGTVLGVPCGVLVARAGLREHRRLARDDLRMFVLRFLFHEGHLQPDDLLDQHHAGVALRSARRIQVPLLLLRIEETAVGAVIGIAAAMLVLPTNTRKKIRSDAHTFFLTLSDLIDASVTSLLGGEATVSLTETARQLDWDLAQFRTTAKPMSRRGGRPGRPPQHSARLADAHRVRPLRANPGPQQRNIRQCFSGTGRRRSSRPPRRFVATSTC